MSRPAGTAVQGRFEVGLHYPDESSELIDTYPRKAWAIEKADRLIERNRPGFTARVYDRMRHNALVYERRK